jgi:hypothetical protein
MTETPENAALALPYPCASLERTCLRRWFEMDFQGARAGLLRLQAAGARGVELLGLVDDPRVEIALLASRLVDPAGNAPPDIQALGCAAACDALLRGDVGDEPLDILRARLAELIARDAALSPHARSALLLRKGLLALILDSNVELARGDFAEGERIAVAVGSLPLELVHRTLACFVDCLAGEVTRADVRLSDVELLCHLDGAGLLPRVLVHSALGLIGLLAGDAERAHAILSAGAALPGVETLSDAVALPLLAHQTYAAADLGRCEEVRTRAQALGERVIPARQALLQAYRHLALGALALRDGQPLRALVHGDECLSSGGPDDCRMTSTIARLLRMQALADLQRDPEARALAAAWVPRWLHLGLRRVAAVARQEQAMLDVRAGEFDRARRMLAAARELVPVGERLVPLHRNAAWLAELESVLTPASRGSAETRARVNIRTLGEFVVEIDGRRIYDRDWKGVRTKMLLIALICAGGQKVPAERLADMLWPDSEGAQAMQNLKVALHRLRRLGRREGEPPLNWVHVKHGLVSLPGSLCSVDAFDLLARLASAGGRQDGVAEACQLHAGEFLPGETGMPWIVGYRQHLREMLERAGSALAV